MTCRSVLISCCFCLGLLVLPALAADWARFRGPDGHGISEEKGLPTRLDPAIDPAAVVAATSRDKKRRGGRVGFALVEAPGDVRTGMPVSPDDLRAAVAELERS